MDFGLWQGIYTVVTLVAFVWIVAWAFSSKRKKDFDEASRLPLEDDSKPPPSGH
jgi:cytochrome c oxidase cbb3-type subunit IV